MERKQDIESPADYGEFSPDGAEKMPTKHYPSSGSMGKGDGKHNTIEGPCTEYGGSYTK